MVLQIGDKGIDFSGYRPNPATVYKDGARFILRYSAGAGNNVGSTRWKLCEVDEIKNAVAAGLDFIANSEWYTTRIEEGSAAGKADGTADLGFWKSRGLNRGASIYVSWDSTPSQNKWGAVDAYLKAYNAALAGYYFVDCYAGTPYLKHALAAGIIRYGWRPNAGYWSGDGLPYQPSSDWIKRNVGKVNSASPAAIWQTGNYWYNKQADENVIVRSNVGSHLQAAATPVKPNPGPIPNPPKPTPTPPNPQPNPVLGEDTVYEIYKNNDSGAIALIGLNRYVPLNYGSNPYSEDDIAVFTNLGLCVSKKVLAISGDRFNKLAKVIAGYPAN